MGVTFDGREWAVHARAVGEIPAKSVALVGIAVRKSMLDLQAEAKRRAPVDTGFLRSSITARQESPTSAVITSGANYAIFQEFGTRYQPGTPHMRPAADKVAPAFQQAVSDIVVGGATL